MDTIQSAIKVVKGGGIIIYPTDTAFGIGCRIDDHRAVDRLFQLRQRPATQAMPVLVSSVDMALTYFDSPSNIVRRLMEKHWPGGLTIVSKCKKELIYSPIRAGGETVGLRMPDHEVPLTIIKQVGVPILGPSANFHGAPTPYRAQDLDPELVKLVDLVVPGEVKSREAGSSSAGHASTVVDCTVEPYRIIRQGTVRLPSGRVVLWIDTANQDVARVVVEIDGKRYEKTSKSRVMKAQMVLPLIEKILTEQAIRIADISEIRVHIGPGSFTGVRVGVAVANSLGFFLGVLVNGRRPPIVPFYTKDW